MKRLYWKRIVLTAAAAIAGMQIAGCGKTEELTAENIEFVYVPEHQEVNMKEGMGMDQINVIGDTIYFLTGNYDVTLGKEKQFLGSIKIGEKEPVLTEFPFAVESSIDCITADMDGNLIGIVRTRISEETGADEPETPEENEAAGTDEGEAEAGIESELLETDMEVDRDEYIMPVLLKMELYTFTTTGEVLSIIDLEEVYIKESYNQKTYVQTDKDGNIYIGCGTMVLVLDKEGEKKFDINVDSRIGRMFSTKEGEVCITYHGNTTDDNYLEVHKIDVTAKALGESLDNRALREYTNYIVTRGTDTDLLYNERSALYSSDSENIFYTYNFGDEAPVELLDWIDCDINSNDVESFTALEDGRILVIATNRNNHGVTELIYLTKKIGSEVPEKKILTLGILGLNSDVKRQVIEFNKKNQEYRVEIKDYVDHSSDDPYALALNQMNTDIAGGKGPDIIDVSSENLEKYAAKGILEDIYPYIDEDKELNREDYLPNVRKAYEKEGKLYTMPPKFYIDTAMAKASKVGERNSITHTELMEIMDQLPEETWLYEYATKSSILKTNLMMNMEEYVNWDTGECKFNSESFIKELEFANRFGMENVKRFSSDVVNAWIREDKLLFMDTYIGNVQEYQHCSAIFGEPVSLVGYPTTKENGSFLHAGGFLLAMNAKSGNKDGVWQFIRTGFTKDGQERLSAGRGGGDGFPVMISALEEKFKADMREEYYEDMEGNKQKRKPKITYNSGEVYAATEEEVETVRELIESIDTVYSFDGQIYKIIKEEAQKYFEGQMTAKDVAEIIQSRMQVYVSENRHPGFRKY